MASSTTPLTGGTQRPIGRSASSLGTLAAKVPASSKGSTCPNPKLLSSTMPTSGRPLWAIQPSSTASTGVVQGDAASPKARPAATGASGAGTFWRQLSGSGPAGRGIFSTPSRFSPINTASTATSVGTRAGTWP